MWIAIGFIGLAIAMMLGPILLMQPSKHQRRLARLRETATEQGLKVRMAPMPAGAVHAGEVLAFYYRSWPDQQAPKEGWMLARQAFAHELHFFDDWDWIGQRLPSPACQNAIRSALPDLPDSVVAVEASPQSLSVCWLEQTAGKTAEQAVTEISAWLHKLMAQVSRV